MSEPPLKERRKDRDAGISWKRVLLVLALTWLAVMLAIYWIIRTARW